jgi:toxin YoeB
MMAFEEYSQKNRKTAYAALLPNFRAVESDLHDAMRQFSIATRNLAVDREWVRYHVVCAARQFSDSGSHGSKQELDLVQAILRDPFDGIGKPEPLKYLGRDVWSRRITQEHRCVYLIKSDRVEFLQGRYHY